MCICWCVTGIGLYMFRTLSLSIIRNFFTVHTAIGICHTGFADSLLAGSGWNGSSILILKNSWWWNRNCLKHVEFYSKNKFEILVHLVGFIIRINHAAQSSECQKQNTDLVLTCRDSWPTVCPGYLQAHCLPDSNHAVAVFNWYLSFSLAKVLM